jgi:hypothetical protein
MRDFGNVRCLSLLANHVSRFLVLANPGKPGMAVANRRLALEFRESHHPVFRCGDAPIGSITPEQIRKLALQRKRTVKPKTLWHDVTNIRALFNWAKVPGGEGE